MKNKVYIAEITTILPHLFTSSEVIEILYPKDIDNGRPHRFARRSVGAVGITYRPTILSREAFPDRALATPEYHPLEWGKRAVKEPAVYAETRRPHKRPYRKAIFRKCTSSRRKTQSGVLKGQPSNQAIAQAKKRPRPEGFP